MPPAEAARASLRLSMREALLRLSEERLVDVFPQHATVVSRIHIPTVRQAHFLRLSLELELVRTLAQQAPPSLLEMQAQLLRLQVQLAQEERFAEFVQADRQFHHAMYAAAGMQTLWELIHRFCGHTDRLRRLHLPSVGKMAAILADHQAIANAIAQRQPEAAQQALRAHLSGTLAALPSICAQYPDYIDLDGQPL